MPESARALYGRIQEYAFDQGTPRLSFQRRLARENGWTIAFAVRVLSEYRRFLLLAMTAGHPVTPSDQVDQAWHLHLAYTRSYWERLCGHVLGRPLHHEPTAGGQAESEKYADWYVRTLESYRRFFDAEPPSDIWPAPAARFAHADSFVRIKTSDHFIVRRPWRRR